MTAPFVLVSGFGPFPEAAHNPSGDLALALAERPPEGWEVRSGVLPVSFRRGPAAYDALLAACEARRPSLLLSLGIHRAAGFRIERRARRVLEEAKRIDVDGAPAVETSEGGPPLTTTIDVDALAALLDREAPERCWVSEEAGGYVCERLYRHVLERARDLAVPGLFVHVPKLRFTELPRQEEVLRRLLDLVASTLQP